MNIEEVERQRNAVQVAIDERKSIESRRAMGQFSTPGKLAHDIVEETLTYCSEKGKPLRVLEPSVGTGAFVVAAQEVFSTRIEDVRGYELDEDFFNASFDKRFEELQKVKMYIADRNVYGVDLNPIAVELAEVSL